MRPTYETESDVSREWACALKLAEAWDKIPQKLPKFYPCDIMMVSKKTNSPVGWVEVKCRNINWGQYPTLHISVHKVADLMTLAEASGLPAFIAVQMNDCLVAHKIAHPYPVVFGGRTDRNDPEDMEPVFDIPFSSFKRVA